MNTIRFIAFLAVLILFPVYADARPIKFGFYYTNDTLKEFGSESNIQIRLHDAIWRTAREFNIAIVISFIKPLPFQPPPFIPPDEKEAGIESSHFLSVLHTQLTDTQNTDYIFTVTSAILWHLYITPENTIKYKQLDGITLDPRITGKHVILRNFRQQKHEYFAEVLWHEWGHRLNLEHQDNDTCSTIHFVMCNRTPLENPLIIEKSFRDTVRAAAQMFEKQRD